MCLFSEERLFKVTPTQEKVFPAEGENCLSHCNRNSSGFQRNEDFCLMINDSNRKCLKQEKFKLEWNKMLIIHTHTKKYRTKL